MATALLVCSACSGTPAGGSAETPSAEGAAVLPVRAAQQAPPPVAPAVPGGVTKLLVFVVENHSRDQMRVRMPLQRQDKARWVYGPHLLFS